MLISGGCTDPRTLELVRVVRSRLLPGRVLCVADPAAVETGKSLTLALTSICTYLDIFYDNKARRESQLCVLSTLKGAE